MKSNEIDKLLSTFSSLPDSAFVREPVVRALFACSHATIWRMVNAEMIPAPKRIGFRMTAWNVGHLRKALGEINDKK